MRLGEYEEYAGARTVGSLIGNCLAELGLAGGLNRHKIYKAWNEVSGAGKYTLGQTFRDGTLTVRLSSSVMRNELYPRINSIREKLNAAVTADPLFTRLPNETEPVKKIELR